MRLNTELLPETGEVQASRDALLRDLGLMRDLISDLLESERLASPHATLQREPTDLTALLADVLGSLLDNALRHSDGAPQPPTIAVQVDPPVDGQGQGVRITVRDFGPGVPDDQLPHLAQPFYRPDAARSRAQSGVGLGLYLCKLVAQAHGGTFKVRNAQPGLEASVTLRGPPA